MTAARSQAVYALALAALALPVLFAAAPPGRQAAKPSLTYERDIAPLVKTYCLRCHTAAKPRGGVNLESAVNDATVLKHLKVWEKVGDVLRSDEMPPAGEKKPTAPEMDRIFRWVDAVVYKVDCAGPRDPGRVTI